MSFYIYIYVHFHYMYVKLSEVMCTFSPVTTTIIYFLFFIILCNFLQMVYLCEILRRFLLLPFFLFFLS